MFNTNSNWLIIPISIFCFLQIYHIYRRFKQTFAPIRVFRIKIEDLEEAAQEPLSPEKLDKLISENSDNKDRTSEEKKFKEMEYFLIINEFAKVFNFKLKEIISRRVYMLSFLGKALFSFFIAMVYFGAINYCLYQMKPVNYNISFIPKYFDFFYYSFFTVIPDGTDITPISLVAKVFRMAGVSVGVIINLLLLTVYLAISNEKFKESLEHLSNFTDNYSKGINDYFENKFGHNPTEGLKKLRSLGSSIESTITFLRKLMNQK